MSYRMILAIEARRSLPAIVRQPPLARHRQHKMLCQQGPLTTKCGIALGSGLSGVKFPPSFLNHVTVQVGTIWVRTSL
jgi:hypothetical protein